ncbi:MAG TPA: SRPBCC family protein [Egicoccus sp.]|nr:SRPBCC family protein [Egicoccus sp.]HSK21744.1 SRPBCC family protein [Egicoccus sp.]
MSYRFSLETHVEAPADVVFDAALDVDLHTTTMGSSRESAAGGVTSGRLGRGDSVTWRARHFGVWWRMTSRIDAYQRPTRFVDVQTAGPFRTWRHEHTFEPHPAGGTLMRDEVVFSAPLGILGRLVERLVLGRYMRRLIERRSLALKALVER